MPVTIEGTIPLRHVKATGDDLQAASAAFRERYPDATSLVADFGDGDPPVRVVGFCETCRAALIDGSGSAVAWRAGKQILFCPACLAAIPARG